MATSATLPNERTRTTSRKAAVTRAARLSFIRGERRTGRTEDANQPRPKVPDGGDVVAGLIRRRVGLPGNGVRPCWRLTPPSQCSRAPLLGPGGGKPTPEQTHPYLEENPMRAADLRREA